MPRLLDPAQRQIETLGPACGGLLRGLLIRGFTLVGVVSGMAACQGSTGPAESFRWIALAAGETHTCGLAGTGETFCWGWFGDGWFLLPTPIKDSLMPRSAVPLPVAGGHRFRAITVGGGQMCGLDADGRAFCWGANQNGELGDDSFVAKLHPSRVAGGLRWRVISAGMTHTCGVTVDDQAYCWGNQWLGLLGNGVAVFGGIPHPVPVLGGLVFSRVDATYGTCGITVGGQPYCWGNGKTTPFRLWDSVQLTTIEKAFRFACGIARDARAYCWGGNAAELDESSLPAPIGGDLRWARLSLGDYHACGLTTDGALYCWGDNTRGQFGNGTTTGASSPVLIAPPGNYVAVAAGGYHTCALTPAGSAFCWGEGNHGQLGDGVFEDRLWPVQVAPPSR